MNDLTRACSDLCPGVRGMGAVEALFRALTPHVGRVGVIDGDLPWGRYIVARGEDWNLQLDVFSAGYVGGRHKHDTWGMFWVVRGGLWAESFAGDEGETPLGTSWVPAGSGQCFCPPASDWHRVSAAEGPQPVSFHLYGPGFDLDVGVGSGPDGRARTYRRGPAGDNAAVLPALVSR